MLIIKSNGWEQINFSDTLNSLGRKVGDVHSWKAWHVSVRFNTTTISKPPVRRFKYSTYPCPTRVRLLKRRRGGVSLVFVFPNAYQVSDMCCSSHSLTKLLRLGYQRYQAHCHLRGWVSSLQPGSVSESFCLFISLLYPRSTCLRNMHTSTCTSFCLSSTLLMDSWHQRWPTLVLSVRNKSWSYLRDALVTVR